MAGVCKLSSYHTQWEAVEFNLLGLLLQDILKQHDINKNSECPDQSSFTAGNLSLRNGARIKSVPLHVTPAS